MTSTRAHRRSPDARVDVVTFRDPDANEKPLAAIVRVARGAPPPPPKPLVRPVHVAVHPDFVDVELVAFLLGALTLAMSRRALAAAPLRTMAAANVAAVLFVASAVAAVLSVILLR